MISAGLDRPVEQRASHAPPRLLWDRDGKRAVGEDFLEWKRALIAAPLSKRNSMLVAALQHVAWTTRDADLMRLADLFEAVARGSVASALAPNLPDKPGMASAYAISTLISGGWSKRSDGTWQSDKVEAFELAIRRMLIFDDDNLAFTTVVRLEVAVEALFQIRTLQRGVLVSLGLEIGKQRGVEQ